LRGRLFDECSFCIFSWEISWKLLQSCSIPIRILSISLLKLYIIVFNGTCI